MKRTYYSVRTGIIPQDHKVNFEVLKRLFLVTYRKLENEGYFQQYFGIDCQDGYIPGELGEDIETVMFSHIRKGNLYPIYRKINDFSEDDLFDVIEFLHDYCSKGINGNFHTWNNCGYHYV